MKRRYSFVACALAVLITVVTATMPVSAQQKPATGGQGNGLKIAPVRNDLTIVKGASQIVKLYVENITAYPMTVGAVVNDFVPSSDENGEPKIILDPNQATPGNSFKNLVAPISPVTLAPNERKTVEVTLSIPPNAASGGYYGAVRFSPVTGNNNKSVALSASVGSIFLIRVPGNITEKLSIESFGVAHNNKVGSLFNSGPLTVVTRFRNFGNIHVQPFGKIYVKNMAGKTLQVIEINNTQPRGSVLPASIRKFSNPIDQKKLFGKYSVEANFGYGTNGDLLTAQKTFYVIPYKLIGLITIIILGIIFGLPRLIRKYNQSVVRRASKNRR